jgi:hypothetical protein
MGPDEQPELDISRILETLDRHGVEYLIVGADLAPEVLHEQALSLA